MSVVKEVNIKLTGQVSDDYNDKDYVVLLAKVQVIAAEYGLELQEG